MPFPQHAGGDLPPVIQRAITRAMDPNLDLSHPERVALATLIARAEARDGTQAFWVRRANLGELFGRVERTVSNWLSALEDKGWITKEQGRTRWGDFSSLTVHLTEQAAAFLGLLKTSDRSTTYRKKTSVAIRDQASEQSFGDMASPCGQLGLGMQNQRSLEAFAAKVPADCKLLLELGLQPAAIFKAMRLASGAGQRLGQIVAVRADALRKATRPLAYLRALIKAPVDYKALANEHHDQQTRSQEQLKRQAEVSAVKKAYAGATLAGAREGTRLKFWNADGYVTAQELRGSAWVDVGAVVGAALQKLWDRLIKERPPMLAS